MLRLINNLKERSKKTTNNLATFITKHERDLWLIYVQKDVFTDKQYELLKHDLEFIVIHGVIRCKEDWVIVRYHLIPNILYFFKNIILQS